ncbi:MAG: cation:proton antiporter [Bacteroidia bacterium]|nr:cation:proton antiporter [Bacteroidia bacterium]MCF8427433.1 cation:proton antiporter [Bacteroidia bacterium]
MAVLNRIETIYLLLSLGTMLIAARMFGEFFRKFKMPLVVGELIAGVVLGPTILGYYLPEVSEVIYTQNPHSTLALSGIINVSIVMLLFVAGMELNLSLIRQQGKAALSTSLFGLVIPFGLGFLSAFFAYEWFGSNSSDKLVFSLFIGTSMAISALPVIARTLIDLDLFRTKIGSIIITSAMFNDLIGWFLFSIIIGMLKGSANHSVLYTSLFTLGYAAIMLTVGRIFINKSLPWAEKNFTWPGGFLSLSLGLAFLGAAFTEYIGLHAIFGAFIIGIAIGDSVHVKEKTKDMVNQFVSNIFAPFFFVSIGFKVNFIAHFNLGITALILLLAMVGKIYGAYLGGRIGGLDKKESLAVGFGLNARGAMEIILASLALQAKLIGEEVFVAIVIMAVLTSVLAGPMLNYLIKGKILPDISNSNS